MKKRFLAILLALCMVMTLLPVTAWAADEVTVSGLVCDESISSNWGNDTSGIVTVTLFAKGNMQNALRTAKTQGFSADPRYGQFSICLDGLTPGIYVLQFTSNLFVTKSVEFEFTGRSYFFNSIPLTEFGRANGTVTDATTGAELSGVAVNVYTSSGELKATALTGTDGKYSIETEYGTYNIEFVLNGYNTARFEAVSLGFAGAISSGNVGSSRIYAVKMYPDSGTSVNPGEIVDSGKCGDSSFWTLNSSGLLTIWGDGHINSYLNYPAGNQPWKEYFKEIEKIDIKYGIETIGNGAFQYCENVRSISIPNTVLTIGHKAFWDCDSLKDIYYGGSKDEGKRVNVQTVSGFYPGISNAFHQGRVAIHYNSIGPDDISTPTPVPTVPPIPTISPNPTTKPTTRPTTPPVYDTDLTQLASQWNRAYDQYTDSIKTTLEKNAGAAVHGDNLDNLARKLESNYGAVAVGYGLTKEQKVVVYKALLKMLAQETGYQLDFSGVSMSKLDKVPSAICKAVANGIGSSTYTHTEAGGKKVEISLSCNFGTNFGLASYYEKGKFVNSVVISTTKKDVEKIVSEYMTDLLDMEADALQQSAKEAYKDLSKAFFGATPDSFSKKIVKNGVEKISAKLARYKLGDVAKIAANCYNYYQFIKGIQTGESTEKLLSMLAGQTDITFSDPNAKEIATQKALKLMEKTRKEIEKKLKKEPTGIGSFFAKTLGWRVSDFNCPINIAVYDGANKQVGYVGDDDEWFDEEIIYIERNGDTKTIYSKEPVSFKVTGTDYGTLNYTVEEFKNGVPVGRTNFFDIDLYEGINIDISVPSNAVSGNSVDMVVDGTTYLTLDSIAADEYDSAKVTLNGYAESSGDGIVSGFGEYVKGDTVKLLAQANAGYVFLGWKDTNGNLIGVSPTLELIAKENSTYTAQFEKPANLDSSGNEPTATPGPTNSPDSTNPPEGHYVISYSPGDGSGTMSTGTAKAGTSFTLPPCAFTPPAGKQFRAWLINGKEYNPGVAYLFTADTTVTAVWQAKDANPSDYENIILPFIDVPDTAWYIIPVKYVYANHLMNGYSSTTFGPGHSLTRAQFAQIIYNLEGKPTTNPQSVFTDVKAGQWYANAVTWAAEQEIVSGIGNNQFAPNRHITREELATMLWRYAKRPKPVKTELDFADANKVSGFAKEAMLWANESGIINGKGNGVLDPKGKATRAETAQMLMNYLVKATEAPSRELTEDECWKIAIEYWDNQIVPGKTTVFHATKKETFDGKIYYHYYLKQKVNSYWSAIDYLFVDVSTGSRYFGVQRPEYKV